MAWFRCAASFPPPNTNWSAVCARNPLPAGSRRCRTACAKATIPRLKTAAPLPPAAFSCSPRFPRRCPCLRFHGPIQLLVHLHALLLLPAFPLEIPRRHELTPNRLGGPQQHLPVLVHFRIGLSAFMSSPLRGDGLHSIHASPGGAIPPGKCRFQSDKCPPLFRSPLGYGIMEPSHDPQFPHYPSFLERPALGG